MAKTSAYLFPTLVVGTALVVAGCSGSSSSRWGGGGNGEVGDTSGVQGVVVGAAETTEGVEETVDVIGDGISQAELPVGNEITSGTGEVVSATAGALGSVSGGLRDGLGDYRENDNFVGATAGGVTGAVDDVGETLVAAGGTVEALNTLPVLMQVDEETGLVTALGGTVEELGINVSTLGHELTLAVTDEDSPLAQATTELGGAIRPVLMEVDDGVGHVGDALVIGPVASDLLDEAAGVVVGVGSELGAMDPRLAGLEGTLGGVGALVSETGGLLTAGGEPGDLSGLDGLGDLLGGDGLPGESDVLGDLAGALEDLTGTLAGDAGGLPLEGGLGDLTATLDGLTNALTVDAEGGLGGEAEGSLLAADGDGLGQLTGALEGLTGTLTSGLGD